MLKGYMERESLGTPALAQLPGELWSCKVAGKCGLFKYEYFIICTCVLKVFESVFGDVLCVSKQTNIYIC